jgi:hypothetical protein
VKLAARAALVYDRPVAAAAHPDGDRLHRATAIGGAVARNIVNVFAPQAPGAVVAVRRAEGFAGDGLPATGAAEPFRLESAAASGRSISSDMAVLWMRSGSQGCVLSFLSVRRRIELVARDE